MTAIEFALIIISLSLLILVVGMWAQSYLDRTMGYGPYHNTMYLVDDVHVVRAPWWCAHNGTHGYVGECTITRTSLPRGVRVYLRILASTGAL